MNKILLLLLSLAAGRLAAQCVSINDCPANPPKFQALPNSPLFWNEPYWQDPNGLHDLPEGTVTLSLKATALCPNQDLSFRYLLFLDTDNNGSQETVINSEALPGFNSVNFNNAGNPNYTGGTPRAFDERPVAANQKYGFALQQVINGASTTAHVQWNTQASPGTYADPQLPYGTHRIKWFVTNNLGEENSCEYAFTVRMDFKPPTVVCKNGLVASIHPTGFLQVFDADFIQYAEDNVTPVNLLRTGMRKSGTGTNFPFDSLGQPSHSVTFNCAELGTQIVEVWAIDEAGNADFCETYIIVNDDNVNCPPVGTHQPGDPKFQTTVPPNPFSDALHLTVRCPEPATLLIRLLSPTGQELWRTHEKMSGGDQEVLLPAPTLSAGLYWLCIEDASGARRMAKVVKQ